MNAEITAHPLDLRQYDAGVLEQCPSGWGRNHAAPPPLEQRNAQHRLHPADPRARRRQREVNRVGAPGYAALLDHGGEETKINQIEPHESFRIIRNLVLDIPHCRRRPAV
ncbi:MAG TPA: hypothetical protein VJQ77_01305 [Novosphingobium sp.]|nr:hypothetical protein [Novosphingobium sp.]